MSQGKEYDVREISATRVCDLDDSDKPREKALVNGIKTLSNVELLAIILGSGMPGKSVIELSREILNSQENNLARVERMSVHELMSKFKGVGSAKAISLAAAFELGKRYQRDLSIPAPRVVSSQTIYDYVRNDVENLPYEVFLAVHVNRANRITYVETLSRGGTAATVVDVKLVMKSALDKMSDGLVFVHNHPSGNLRPSHQDDQLTQKLKSAASIIDVRVLDHLIISSEGYYSYNDEGRL